MKALTSLIMISAAVAFADETPVQGLPVLDQITQFLKEAGTGMWVVIVTALLEALMRLVKTEKPKSILLVVSFVAKQLSKMFEALAGLVDKVIPQNLK